MFCKNKELFLTLALFSILLNFVSGQFPNDPKPCKYGESECIQKAITYYLHEKSQGDSAIDLHSIDPLDMGTFQLKQGAESPVNIDLTFKNNQIIGASSATAYKTRGFGKDLTKKHEFRLRIPHVHLVGDYTASGRVLLLPVSGSGKNNITMINADLIMQFVGVPFEKDGETYMKSDKVKVMLEPEKMQFQFGNLFNGDKALGDNMNKFLNENWLEIYKEIRDTFSNALTPVFGKIIDYVFAKHPYNKYFTE